MPVELTDVFVLSISGGAKIIEGDVEGTWCTHVANQTIFIYFGKKWRRAGNRRYGRR